MTICSAFPERAQARMPEIFSEVQAASHSPTWAVRMRWKTAYSIRNREYTSGETPGSRRVETRDCTVRRLELYSGSTSS